MKRYLMILLSYTKKQITERWNKIMGEIIGGVEVSYLAINYASLIKDNLYSFDKVKKRFKLDTAICLVVWGYEDKVSGTDETGKEWLELAKEKIEKAQEE